MRCNVEFVSEQKFQTAFESIADVIEKAAHLPDHRERPREPLVVSHHNDDHTITVNVEDAKIRSMQLSDMWLDTVTADEAADQITAVVNAAFEEWNRQQLNEIMTVTPDMKELHAAITGARQQLDDAWAATLAESKVPRS